ncbi:MAG: hypothetical protein LUG85_00305, partial [Clostridiales bacterium]|nr:hypothetical protein [Clostridiales bacterium]
MQSASKNGKRALSVLLSVLMVFSVWAGVISPTIADAATAGNYYVKITWQVTNEGSSHGPYSGYSNFSDSSNSNNCSGISLFYKANNGTGDEYEVYWDVGYKSPPVGGTYVSAENVGSHYVDDSEGTDYYLTATISGFPTSIYACIDYNAVLYSTICAYKITKIEVGSSSSSTLTTIWAGTLAVSSRANSYIASATGNTTSGSVTLGGSTDQTCSTTTPNWVKPKVNSVTWTNTSLSTTVPSDSSTNTVTTKTATIYDQYGVTWYQAPYYYLSETDSPGTGTAITGVTANSTTSTRADTGTISVTNDANEWVLDGGSYYRYVYVTAMASSTVYSETTTPVKITNYNVKATFVNEGTTLKTQSVYYGYGATAPTGTYTKESDADNHYTFNGWDTDYTCLKEDTTITAAYTPEAHSFDYEVTTKPTCTTAGTGTYTCSVCGYSYEEEIPATGHTWDEGVITTEATCEDEGVITYTCTACGDTKTETIEALGHNYSTEWTVDTEATCTTEGSMSHHCTRCDAITDVTVIPATGHTWDEGVITTEATCEDE